MIQCDIIAFFIYRKVLIEYCSQTQEILHLDLLRWIAASPHSNMELPLQHVVPVFVYLNGHSDIVLYCQKNYQVKYSNPPLLSPQHNALNLIVLSQLGRFYHLYLCHDQYKINLARTDNNGWSVYYASFMLLGVDKATKPVPNANFTNLVLYNRNRVTFFYLTLST